MHTVVALVTIEMKGPTEIFEADLRNSTLRLQRDLAGLL